MPWPCNETKYIVHFPETREIWSYGSGYGGNALLGKKCYALRIASVMARDEGWLAEHMLILKLTSPEGKAHYIAAAFPSACGKTNLAMLQPTLPGWKAETIGDDICWMRFGDDGRLYAINPEAGFFGVAPGTGIKTNRNAIDALCANSIFTNVALTAGRRRLVGRPDRRAARASDRLEGPRLDPGLGRAGRPPQRPLHRAGRPVPDHRAGMGRSQGRADLAPSCSAAAAPRAVPLVTEAFDWRHGVFLASNVASEGTAAAENKIGELRRDPFAMLPFCGYNMGDYFGHWLKLGAAHRRRRSCRGSTSSTGSARTPHGKFVWPGYGENSRVLKWIVERLEGKADAHDTPIGRLPVAESLDVVGLNLSEAQLHLLLSVDRSVWKEEAALIPGGYDRFGERLPTALWEEHQALVERLEAWPHDGYAGRADRSTLSS